MATFNLITLIQPPILMCPENANITPRASHMKRLYDICQSKQKIWKPLPNGDHNTSVGEPSYFEYVSDFVASCPKRKE